MREEDKVINFRPELAMQLYKCMDFAKTLYSVNFQKFYYESLEIVYKDSNSELAELLHNASLCFGDTYHDKEMFQSEYEYELKKHNIGYISQARAAYALFKIFEPELDKLKEEIDMESFTKAERYMINDFFRKLKAPMRNPNIEIKDGATKCYYDKTYDRSFEKDLLSQLKYLEQNCQDIIDIFATPDEEHEISEQNNDIDIVE